MTDPSTLEVEVEETISSLPVEDTHPSREIFKPHPGLIAEILITALVVIDEDPKLNELEVLFTSVREFIHRTSPTDKPESVISAIFAYYIEVYRTLHSMRKRSAGEDASADPQYLKLYNEATLSLFDLYLACPNDLTIRRTIPLAAMALNEVAVAHQSADESRPIKEVIENLSTIALISQSVREYVKGTRRRKNFEYIEWLRGFYAKLLSDHDLSFMKEDPVLKIVIPQITKSEKVIEVPPELTH